MPEKLWSWTTRTGRRKVKKVMDKADLKGIYACSKGIRHGFGVLCVNTGIPLNYIQQWMGHTILTSG